MKGMDSCLRRNDEERVRSKRGGRTCVGWVSWRNPTIAVVFCPTSRRVTLVNPTYTYDTFDRSEFRQQGAELISALSPAFVKSHLLVRFAVRDGPVTDTSRVPGFATGVLER